MKFGFLLMLILVFVVAPAVQVKAEYNKGATPQMAYLKLVSSEPFRNHKEIPRSWARSLVRLIYTQPEARSVIQPIK